MYVAKFIDLCRYRHRSIYADDVIMPMLVGVLGLGAAGLGLWGFWWFGVRHSYRASRKARSLSVGL